MRSVFPVHLQPLLVRKHFVTCTAALRRQSAAPVQLAFEVRRSRLKSLLGIQGQFEHAETLLSQLQSRGLQAIDQLG